MSDAIKNALHAIQQAIMVDHPNCTYAEVKIEHGVAFITVRETEYVCLRELEKNYVENQ